MTSSRFLQFSLTSLALTFAACSSGTTPGSHTTGGSGTAGQTSTGGRPASGGSTGSGGGAATGGNTTTGGKTETGGTLATGGLARTGGQTQTGGVGSTGGQTTTGGASGSGGQSVTGGTSGTGGVAAQGGQPGTGGVAGTGGRATDGGVVPPDAATTNTGGTSPQTGGTTGGTFTGTKTPGTAQTGDITVNPATTYQTMDGFGIADVWQGKNTSTAEQRTLFWDPDKGIGMTILRVGIDTTGKVMGDAAFVDAPEVVKFGGKVWAAPWSPPANLKDNNDVNNGGALLTTAYDTWASTLAAFPAYFKQNAGVDLWGISAQNEPNWKVDYKSCIYDKTQMNNFIKVLGPKLKALNPPVKLLAAEPQGWNNVWSGSNYGTAIVGDPTVSALVDIIATHDYDHRGTGNTLTRPAPPAGVKQHIWQTEVYYSPDGAGLAPALEVAKGIYAAVVSGGASGWVYWWTSQFVSGGTTASPSKRVYAMGNYSKFVRPGFVRVAATGTTSAVQILPFVNPATGNVAIVALNLGTSAQNVSLFVAGSAWPASVTPYVTSASANLAAGTAIPLTAGRFSASLPGESVTTFVGKP